MASPVVRRLLISVLLGSALVCSGQQQQAKPRPRVVVIGVNGMEWDFIRPLLLKGELPNLAHVIERGTYGKLRTISAPNCPKVYTAIATSTPPEENGITGFMVGGVTASTTMLKQPPLWSILSEKGVTVGLANVPATFPALPVNGYTVTGMLTRGKDCEDGVLCAPLLSQVQGGAAVYPPAMTAELEANIGDFWIDCSRMPTVADLAGKEESAIDTWLAQVARIRSQQSSLFEYLLTHHPTDFTMMAQSCEDRVGHWLYPIQPHNVGYDPRLHNVRLDAFPSQYRAFDAVLGKILQHVPPDAYVFVISDHGIKPLREFEAPRRPGGHSHDQNTPIIAHHDFEDGDDVPGFFAAMGPNIKHDVRLMGLPVSVFDLAPTILHLYGIPAPRQMKGRVLKEIFEAPPAVAGNSRTGP
jgi:predicted AlkP superfamily phosphohydrolase/phosphomutase